MAKKVYLDRQRAMMQWFRWMEVYRAMDNEAKKPFPRSLEKVIFDLNAEWRKCFEKTLDGYERKPKFIELEFA